MGDAREGFSDSEAWVEIVLVVVAMDVILLVLLVRMRGMERERWPEPVLLVVVDAAREALRNLRGDGICAGGGR